MSKARIALLLITWLLFLAFVFLPAFGTNSPEMGYRTVWSGGLYLVLAAFVTFFAPLTAILPASDGFPHGWTIVLLGLSPALLLPLQALVFLLARPGRGQLVGALLWSSLALAIGLLVLNCVVWTGMIPLPNSQLPPVLIGFYFWQVALVLAGISAVVVAWRWAPRRRIEQAV